MDISILDGLYVALLFFGTIVLILLCVVLVKIIKILWPVMEVVSIYNRFKQYLGIYSQIPDSIRERALNILKK